MSRLMELSDETHPVTRAVVVAYEEGAERALLERDVADVERAVVDPSDSGALTGWERHDCEAWLARVKAVLG